MDYSTKRSAKWRRRRRRGERNGASGLGINTTNNESTPHSATNQLSLSNKNSTGEGIRKVTRTMKRRYNEIHNVDGVSVEDLPRIEQLAEKEHEEKDENEKHPVRSVWKIRNGRVVLQPVPRNYWPMRHALRLPILYEIHRKPKTMQKHKKVRVHAPTG